MSSAVAELDNVLQSMLHLKPPGVSGSKINSLTTLCTANIQSESVLVGKIYTHFKKAPGTHKLGVLYVVDSVTRQWVDQARKSGQQVGSSATDGTFAAGVHRVTELLPSLMNDIISSAPDDQKPKIKKLVEIWERSSTFPAPMLSSIKSQIDAAPSNNAESTTPINSPGPGFVPLGQDSTNPNPSPATQQNPSSILEALKAMAAKQATGTAAMPAASAAIPNNLNALLGVPNSVSQSTTPVNQAQGQNVNPLAALFAGMNNGAQSQVAQNQAPNPLAALFPQQQQAHTAPNPAPVGHDAQATLQLVQLMAQQGIPPDQWAAALQVLNTQNQAGKGGLPFPPPPVPGSNLFGQANQSRDRDGQPRSPPDSGRRRSRSPDYGRRAGRPASPGNDRYRNGNDNRNDRRGNEYRQRSPVGRKPRSLSPVTEDLPPPGEKRIEWDHNMAKDNIKVLSRTLFVGGVTSNESHLRSLFSRFGIVQTCIVNVDKRHAFVKMINRKDAEAARIGMEEYRDGSTQLRTKWGVGFGPRDCSDYQTGISIIPVYRLTDADRKWMVNAEYGGTGGKPIQEGMIVEEPDIEIGAGVSSKAMSKRIPTDQGGRRGPQSSNRDREEPSRDRDRRRTDRYGRDDDRRENDRPGSSAGNPNMMPFPMGFPTMPNGMPMLPPGFPFPFLNQNQGNENTDQ